MKFRCHEKAIAYRLTAGALNNQIINGRGPMIAQLVAGSDLTMHNKKGKKLSQLKAGKYLYIKSGTAFYFSANGNAAINMVLFEIK